MGNKTEKHYNTSMMEAMLAKSNIWTDRSAYEEAERIYLERLAQGAPSGDPSKKSSLAGEIAKAIEHIKTSLEDVGNLKDASSGNSQNRVDAVELSVKTLQTEMKQLKQRVESIEKVIKQLETKQLPASQPTQQKSESKPTEHEDDDDMDLFGSDSEEDEEAERVKQQRVAEYAARKSKKPTLIAKSNIILDVKPWDDETDMKVMEQEVRKIEMDGLVWGASKLVPLAYGIKKLQISCVVEDEKVSVDDLQEKIEKIEEYVQSIDIAAFNKV